MKELKILRKMLESEEPTTDTLNLNEEEKKWFTIGFNLRAKKSPSKRWGMNWL